ncbi:sugar phosphate isomerase/epimerase [soil metagenome]
MQIASHHIGVCSWSLQPASMGELVSSMKQLGLEHVQLALRPLITSSEASRGEELRVLRESGLKLTAGMIGFAGEDYSTIANIRKTGGYLPDATWEIRRDETIAAASLARELGLSALTTHIGFVPASSDGGYEKMLARVAEIADALASQELSLLMETGQETAPELLQFLNDVRCRNVEVNFDPANMILYGAGDPHDAVRVLGRHIRHVHIKDATLSDQPRMKWGNEVPFGTGQVRPRTFLDALHAVEYFGPLVIEREAGPDRMDDIRDAIAALREAAS